MKEVDRYIATNEQWGPILQALRVLLNESELTEEFKWRAPCYTYAGKNVAMLASFKDNCALSFLKGELLSDPKNILEKPGENSRFVRVVRFTDIDQLDSLKNTLQGYIDEAVANERSGKKVKPKKTLGEDWPAELQEKFAEVPGLETAFAELTPGRQRGYLLYFNGAKQSATRGSRIERYREKILSGKGFHDCHCGLSQRMPRCDGSHKTLKAGE